ncbi:MAG TPA: M48 family metallopeptidase [Thermodesulfobacteriota bacterium]|nr:M48 family metallopeptidase [Deltaproteobacteria bacterium]HQO76915.1 M48 family metallopeptidase [Thermodesulfobacteriota bacterium]
MDIRIIRSRRRTKTVGARIVNGILEISAPVHLSDEALKPVIAQLQARMEKKRRKQRLDDAQLEQTAQRLNARYFNNELTWASISWSMQQDTLRGSCTPTRRTIRISHRIAAMPRFVKEYVIMHELAHLVYPDHSPRFWKLVNRFPYTERARGFLMASGLERLEGKERESR